MFCAFIVLLFHIIKDTKILFKKQNMVITSDYLKNMLLNISGSSQKETEATLFPNIYHQITLILQNQRCTYGKRKYLSPLLIQSGIFYSHTVIHSSLFTKVFVFSALCLLLYFSQINLEKPLSPKRCNP